MQVVEQSHLTARSGLPRHVAALRAAHWTEYALEGVELGLFLVSAALCATALFHPASPAALLPDGLRRALMGLAMGVTAVALIYSPIGRRSGAHMNPAVTLTFLRLGRISPLDAAGYVAGQFLGGTAGIAAAWLVLRGALSHDAVNFVTTHPRAGTGVALLAAWCAEFAISFVLMFVVLSAGNHRRTAPLTGLTAGALVAAFIFLEAPISGTSMNPARSFATALLGNLWLGWWVYFTAPPLAMLAAAELYVRLRGAASVHCAKLHHDHVTPCIFRCRFHDLCPSEPSERKVSTP